jgi:NAD(P)-dependent dehydrogenase (short-subunit alcohol dehydrogenase family)
VNLRFPRPRLRPPHLHIDAAVIAVTGASSGIGRATALELARRGAHVVAIARHGPALEDLVAHAESLRGSVAAAPADVSDVEAVHAVVDRIIEGHGRIDGWVNCAAVLAYGRFDEVPLEVHRQVIATDLLGIVNCSAAVVPHFRRQGHGSLVNIASMLGEVTVPFLSSYAASKAGIAALTRSIRHDLKEVPGIGVSCVEPGPTDTPIFRTAGNYSGRPIRAVPPAGDPGRVVAAIVDRLRYPREMTRVGVLTRAAVLGQAIAPPVYDRAVVPTMRLLAFRRGEAPTDPGNVFDPADGWHQTSGQWRRGDLRTAGSTVAAIAVAVAAIVAGKPSRRRPTPVSVRKAD